jgi:phosphomannomutase
MELDAHIFKAYDIRGITPTSLNPDVARRLGRAFGTHAIKCGESTVAIGRDGRLSGPELSKALTYGLCEAGAQVIDVGMVTTPMLYFAASGDVDASCTSGIQITGSHNPRDYNGFKMVLGGRAIYGEEIQTLRRMMEEPDWGNPATGMARQIDIREAYSKRIVSDVKLKRPIKIVIDSGNGIAGASAPDIFRQLGCDVIELFSQVDGNFPNHHPDPSKPENLKDLVAALQNSDAELGLAFDGDGDRLGIVTKDGQTIYPDRQMMLFAQDVLSRVPHSTILFDVKCSQRLAPTILAAGGKPLMFKTGHSLIKAKMREIDVAAQIQFDQGLSKDASFAMLGGEMSGHIFFKERWYGFDDGTYAGARLLEILSASPDANAVLKGLPTSYSTPELNVGCAEGEPPKLVSQLQDLAKTYAPFASATINTIDGLRVDWADGFGLIRASNTTPVLVLRFEGHTEAALTRIETDMMTLLKSVKSDVSFAAGH